MVNNDGGETRELMQHNERKTAGMEGTVRRKYNGPLHNGAPLARPIAA